MFKAILFISHLAILGSASNILLLTPPVTKYASKSHADNMVVLGKGLIEAGHDVSISRQGTVRIDNPGNISFFDVASPLSDETVEIIGETIKKSSVDLLYQNISMFALDEYGKIIWNGLIEDCREMLRDSSMKKRLEEFDLLIIDHFYFCGFILAEMYKKPFIMFECSSYITYSEAVVPSPMSWVPPFMSSLTDKMTITDRAKSVISSLFLSYFLTKLDKNFEKLKAELQISPGKSISQIRKQSELFFMNSNNIFEFPRPLTPNIIYIGGMLAFQPVKKTDIDPKIEEITSKRFGIVVFGSTLNFCNHPSLLDDIRKSLVKFPDVQWIWSLKCSLDKDYPNIHIFKWVPQAYLLSKKNCALFISHGGLNSVYEAMYHGTPMLVIPMPMDSTDNSIRVKRHGMLELLPFHTKDLTFLQEYIAKMLQSNAYKISAERVSSLIKSQKPTPLENAVYWIEHVLEFGGSHLRHSAIDMPTYKLYNLDLLLIALIICLLIVWLMKKLIVFCLMKCCLRFFKKSKKD
ncbi:DgyrCDS14118 [Dimorphilus gyrociliatus]|uniref:DgyrCDS14118 n=1 Tax=Dimorphilus gyrociliatus TaxID=2664684 RepID=A0A7I8WCM5_9ANNE|nr:DgyrCDS14118 [Dimorphilus gyrociliatus]